MHLLPIVILLIYAMMVSTYMIYYRTKAGKFKNITVEQRGTLSEQLNTIEQKNKSLSKLQELVSQKSEDYSKMHKRVIELENAVKKGTGVSLRIETTKVECLFSENELIIMRTGLFKSMQSNSFNLDDIKFYVALIEKVEITIKKMQNTRSA